MLHEKEDVLHHVTNACCGQNLTTGGNRIRDHDGSEVQPLVAHQHPVGPPLTNRAPLVRCLMHIFNVDIKQFAHGGHPFYAAGNPPSCCELYIVC